jgi:sec-independent protein translocase protein TatA
MNCFVIAGMIGGWELIAIVAIVLLIFGGRKIPELMRGLGKGVGEFKKGMKEDQEDSKKENEENKE